MGYLGSREVHKYNKFLRDWELRTKGYTGDVYEFKKRRKKRNKGEDMERITE
jgi:hypothetical protein